MNAYLLSTTDPTGSSAEPLPRPLPAPARSPSASRRSRSTRSTGRSARVAGRDDPAAAALRDRIRSRRHRAPCRPRRHRLRRGRPIAGFIDSGAFAETAITRAARLLRIPGGLSTEQAAALPTAAETATRILRLLRPAPSSTVVVNGAAGAVGSMITQLLVRDGHTVIGTASPSNHDYLRGLGAHPIDHGPDIVHDLRRLAPAGIQRRIRHHWPRIRRPRHRPHPRAPHRHHRGLRSGREGSDRRRR